MTYFLYSSCFGSFIFDMDKKLVERLVFSDVVASNERLEGNEWIPEEKSLIEKYKPEFFVGFKTERIGGIKVTQDPAKLAIIYDTLRDQIGSIYKSNILVTKRRIKESVGDDQLIIQSITKPPISDGWEITTVRPVKRLNLEDYNISEKLYKRITDQAEGILIAGAPGMGKSTFAQALAEFYSKKNKIVKTIEAPRDLILPDEITQYSMSHGTPQEIHDILLLSRPDYTIFDEMRNTDDFKLFADLRLAGIGLAGVVHATNPIDAIQRFVGRIELGVIPQVIDTVIFINKGNIAKVLSLNMTVKVPSGMTEADLARPVVIVNDFETKKLEYELYSYGEETVVIPVSGQGEETPSKKLAAQPIRAEFSKYCSNCKVELTSDHRCTVYVPCSDIAKIIGKEGKNITEIEKRLGIGIDIKELTKEETQGEGTELSFNTQISKNHVVLNLDERFSGKNVDIFVDKDYLLTANIGKKGIVKLSKKSKIARILQDAINMKEDMKVYLKQFETNKKD